LLGNLANRQRINFYDENQRMLCFVVDANCISEFQKERVSGSEGLACQGMSLVLTNGYIAVDENQGHPIILHEWKSCASHSNSELALDAWIADLMQRGKIKLFPFNKDLSLSSALIKFGVPKEDIKYIKLACGIPAHLIITNDIDFHDPTEKKSPEDRKKKIMKSKKGDVCKYIRKGYSICIEDWEETVARFVT
jgi:hypothetical protein